MKAHKCMDSGCKAPVTHTVERLWLIKGQTPPVLYCCAAHRPGLPSTVPQLGITATFYRTTPLHDK